MERFIRLNRSILDCDLAKGGWRLDEEGIAAIEDEVAELVRIIAQSHRGDIPPCALRHYKTHPPDCHWPGWEDPIRLAQWKNQREDADRLARALRSAVPYREGPTEMAVARGCD